MPSSDEIIVVSGLPRSGTSLMMQMLDLGGIPALTDAIREADTDNPRGYYEFERVKKTKVDPSWVIEARGKVVKLVSAILYDLPASESYRVLFMERNLDEVLVSQEKMLQRLGRPAVPAEQMKLGFTLHLKRIFDWLPSQSHIRSINISYNQLMATPEAECQRIATFLDSRLNIEGMLAAIDPALYRNRN